MKQRFGRGCQYQSSPWSKDTEPLGHKCKKREKKYSFVYIVPVLSAYLTEKNLMDEFASKKKKITVEPIHIFKISKIESKTYL